MRAIILGAGMGTRLGVYTKDRPKGMLPFAGKPLFSHQLRTLRKIGIAELGIVSGYQASNIPEDGEFLGVTRFHNAQYATTNMVASLLCARQWFDQDLIVSYSDIVFEPRVIRAVAECDAPICVAADNTWRNYWRMRYGTTESDLETFEVDGDNWVTSLGKEVACSDGIELRYVGLLKFSPMALEELCSLWERKQARQEVWSQSGNSSDQGYMTDMVHELRGAGFPARAVVHSGGWLEFDTEQDYVVVNKLYEQGGLDEFCHVERM